MIQVWNRTNPVRMNGKWQHGRLQMGAARDGDRRGRIKNMIKMEVEPNSATKPDSKTGNPGMGIQITKSLYSGFTVSAGGKSMPAATVAFVPGSIRMNERVSRLVEYPSKTIGFAVSSLIWPMPFMGNSPGAGSGSKV